MTSYSNDTNGRAKIVALSLAALWLAACGGGGGGTAGGTTQASTADAVAPAPPPGAEPETIPSPAPAPSPIAAPPPPAPPAPTPGPVAVTSTSQQAAPNVSYSVTSTSTQTVVITLPANANLQVGDKVTITGQSAASWRLAQNARQWVVTTNLPGNVAPGATWTERVVDPALPDLKWAGTASSASGNRVAAIANPGGIYLSSDAGASWTRSSAPTDNWTQILMSTDGTKLAAVASAVLYTSNDSGQTWTAHTGSGQFWMGVYMSDDGQRIVGAVMGGSLHISTDGGASFAPIAGTANTDWRTVAGSSDGTRLVAVASLYGGDPANQGVYVSTDSGATWTRRVANGNWTFAAASADGMRMAVLDQGGHPWVSDDGGTTFTQRFGYSIWSGLAVSRDGRVVAAQEPRADAYGYHGYNFISNAAGDNPWDWHGGTGVMDLWWRGISLSYDGNWITAVDNGDPAGAGGGKVFTTTGNRTSGGTLGSITGGQNQMIEVTYQGSGRFTITGQAGGPFAIR